MANRYQAPLALIHLALNQAATSTGARTLPGYEEVLSDLAGPVLENAARFAGDVLSPLNPVGDRTPSHCESNGVVTPPGFVEAYQRFREDGWVSLAAPEQYGGQGLPTLLAAAVTEMWGGANLSFAMCSELTVGALGALQAHGTAQLLDTYSSHLASGEWATAMCLTEPQAGSDLSTVRTRAEPDGDAWRLFGRKIFISWGDHDLTDNIVHFVLARTPDAPPGLKGISLFLVPKKVPGAAGALTRNDIDAVSVEHKMGIRASPTCVMVLGEHGGARGWLIGRLHDGLACMLTMMNHMRLGVGLHSLGLAERSLQLARDYARERRQGRDAAGAQRPIIEHADVRRMLLTMKALTQAARGLAYTAAATLDIARSSPDAAARAAAARRADLLTPIVKAWISDVAVEVSSLGVQVHGGTGFVDDAEISQVYRDARIGPIFEGTNYIQAQDLLGRKVLRDKGAALSELLTEIETAGSTPLIDCCAQLRAATAELIQRSATEPELIGAVAHHYLQWVGVLAGGWQLALSAATNLREIADIATFYAAHVLPRTLAYEATVRHGAAAVAAASATDL
jgi:alkylation response protein AidB-like acyl-CoA dehydrogenase